MINGAHVIIYSTDAEADRAFLRDVVGLRHVDVGEGWLIFEEAIPRHREVNEKLARAILRRTCGDTR